MEVRAGCVLTGGCRSELDQRADHAPVQVLPIWRAETPDRFVERRDPPATLDASRRLGDSALRGAVARLVTRTTLPVQRSQAPMFCLAAPHAPAPELERTVLQMLTHQRDDRGLVQCKLGTDGLERRAVLPGHFDHPGHRSNIEQRVYQGHTSGYGVRAPSPGWRRPAMDAHFGNEDGPGPLPQLQVAPGSSVRQRSAQGPVATGPRCTPLEAAHGATSRVGAHRRSRSGGSQGGGI